MQIQNKELHRVVATAIIHKEGKYLIVRRALDKKVWPGKWTVPGGGLSIDDYINTPPTNKEGIWYYALEQALRREIREEVGLEIGKIDYLLDLAFIRPDNIPVLTLSFYAPWKSGEVAFNDAENIDYAWVSRDEVPQYELIEGILDEIGMVEKILQNRYS